MENNQNKNALSTGVNAMNDIILPSPKENNIIMSHKNQGEIKVIDLAEIKKDITAKELEKWVKENASLEVYMGYRGIEFKMDKAIICPFCKGSESFTTNGIGFRCSQCNSSGDVLTMAMKLNKLPVVKACFKLIDDLGLSIKITKKHMTKLLTTERIQHSSCIFLQEVLEQGATLPDGIKHLYWIETIVSEKGKETHIVNTGKLAKFIRDNTHYIFLREDAKDGVQRFLYTEGYYRLSSDNDFKNLIKKYIPESILKMQYVVEVMNNLYTDDKYYNYNQLNPEKYINFQDGLFNLKTWELEKHTHKVLTAIQLPLKYPKEVTAPTKNYFDNYINYLVDGNEEKKQLIFEFMGVALSNIHGHRMKKALFMVGQHDTGKSKIKELMIKLLGEQNANTLDLETLEARFGSSNVFNKRLIGSNDMSFLKVKELKVFKLLTGGDTLFMEKKGENGFNAKFLGVSWFCCNELPAFGGDKGDGVYKRFAIVECNSTPVPEDKQDTDLVNHMMTEKDYIVSIALTALRNLIDNKFKYTMPEDSKKAIEKYKIDNDSFLTFFDTCTEERQDGKINDKCNKSMIYKVYAEWCKDNNNGYKISKREVHQKLIKMGKDKEKVKDGYKYYSTFTLTKECKQEYSLIYQPTQEELTEFKLTDKEYQSLEREGMKIK